MPNPAMAQPPQEHQWLVAFAAGARGRRRSGETIVQSSTSPRARRIGIEDMEQRGHAWVRSASATVRLATPQDLARVRAQHQKGGTA